LHGAGIQFSQSLTNFGTLYFGAPTSCRGRALLAQSFVDALRAHIMFLHVLAFLVSISVRVGTFFEIHAHNLHGASMKTPKSQILPMQGIEMIRSRFIFFDFLLHMGYQFTIVFVANSCKII
jgi:hypothetical protein